MSDLYKLTLEIDHHELGWISLALDRFVAQRGHELYHERVDGEVERVQRKWDELYRKYHAFPPCVVKMECVR